MSTDPTTSPRRALAGLPPRSGRPSAGVARLIRSNRSDTTQAAAPAEVTGSAPLSSTTERQSPGVPDSQTPGVPKYLQLVRREARMHSGQVSELANLTRALNEARRGGGRSGVGERITDNTLVRVAVDLLLQDPQRLRGTTEDELRASVGLPPLGQGGAQGQK
ncbi:hypothetical protein [uncultured Pseudokineococcus sp.]|uniref:hypothetical protein n=1 Tax=uncultured Pseudokineococcus sp. TaxID=1642928 RepID=UPI002632BF9A|nr:hypothetical protein [uncultured Pseudokineococcus sp.]